MAKKMLIDATHAEETRVVVLDGSRVDEFDFESLNKRQLAGNIYLAKVTRVEPSLQAAFIDYGGNRHGFLAFSEIHPDYYQIPVADREALLAEEAELARQADAEENGEKPKPKSRSRSRSRRKPSAESEGAPSTKDALTSEAVEGDEPENGLVEDLPENAITDAPPPSAASGEKPIHVVEPPEEGDAAEAAVAQDKDGYDDVGADDDLHEEIAVRKPRSRRYKIQEVVKVRQILLVQVVKEERGNKGAALTTYLSLAGRYCVLMPNTARGGGISRKITNAGDRKKLKDIAGDISVPKGAGLIIRTAGSQRTKTEIKRDYEYLLRQWEQIRDLTLKSIAPAPIFAEGSLIKRAIRDLYSRDIDEILVEGERGYREAKDYMKMLMPSHAKNVKLYNDASPLFSRHQVESYLAAMFNPTVQLKSGGYIVIDVTEALVAVDVNSGRATKENTIEDTALKTNLEAAEEVARQARLRDLAGLIVIDFIDMDERRNNIAVEKRLKDKLKTDRARIQIGRISGFGLLEMSRQRLRPGMLEATTAPCPHCHGTGRTRSDDSLSLAIMRELEEEGVRGRTREVLVKAPVAIANYILNSKRDHVTTIETRFDMSVRVEGDPMLISPDYTVEKFKTSTRVIPVAAANPPVSFSDQDDDDDTQSAPDEDVPERDTERHTQVDAARGEDEGDRGPKKRRRRRRRRGRGGENGEGGNEGRKPADQGNEVVAADADAPAPAASAAEEPKPEKPATRSSSRTRTRAPSASAAAKPEADTAPAEVKPDEAPAKEAKKLAPRKRTTSAKPKADAKEAPAKPAEKPAEKPAAAAAKPAATSPRAPAKPRARAASKDVLENAAASGAPETKSVSPAADGDEPKKRGGWWSRRTGS